jgi:hypothetical protein
LQTLLFRKLAMAKQSLDELSWIFSLKIWEKSPILFLSYCFKNFLSNKKINMHPGANVMKFFTSVIDGCS